MRGPPSKWSGRERLRFQRSPGHGKKNCMWQQHSHSKLSSSPSAVKLILTYISSLLWLLSQLPETLPPPQDTRLMKYCEETGMRANISSQRTVEKVTTASDSISTCRAAVPGDSPSVALPSAVLCPSAGLSLVKQTHYPRWLPYRQEEGGDGEQEVMIRSVQVKLAPLITPLIGQLQRASPPPFPPRSLFTRSSYEPWRPTQMYG